MDPQYTGVMLFPPNANLLIYLIVFFIKVHINCSGQKHMSIAVAHSMNSVYNSIRHSNVKHTQDVKNKSHDTVLTFDLKSLHYY